MLHQKDKPRLTVAARPEELVMANGPHHHTPGHPHNAVSGMGDRHRVCERERETYQKSRLVVRDGQQAAAAVLSVAERRHDAHEDDQMQGENSGNKRPADQERAR